MGLQKELADNISANSFITLFSALPSLYNDAYQSPIRHDHLLRFPAFQKLLDGFTRQRRGFDLLLGRFSWDNDSITHLAVDLNWQFNQVFFCGGFVNDGS